MTIAADQGNVGVKWVAELSRRGEEEEREREDGGWREGGKMQFQLLGSEEGPSSHAERQATIPYCDITT